jgi:hypothetical protein
MRTVTRDIFQEEDELRSNLVTFTAHGVAASTVVLVYVLLDG